MAPEYSMASTVIHQFWQARFGHLAKTHGACQSIDRLNIDRMREAVSQGVSGRDGVLGRCRGEGGRGLLRFTARVPVSVHPRLSLTPAAHYPLSTCRLPVAQCPPSSTYQRSIMKAAVHAGVHA